MACLLELSCDIGEQSIGSKEIIELRDLRAVLNREEELVLCLWMNADHVYFKGS